MTFYNYIESARYEMFRLVNGWTREGAETKGRISESLDNARIEYMQKESENTKLRELVVRMRPICMEGKRCTFADRIYINSTMEELRIEVKDD